MSILPKYVHASACLHFCTFTICYKFPVTVYRFTELPQSYFCIYFYNIFRKMFFTSALSHYFHKFFTVCTFNVLTQSYLLAYFHCISSYVSLLLHSVLSQNFHNFVTVYTLNNFASVLFLTELSQYFTLALSQHFHNVIIVLIKMVTLSAISDCTSK